MSQAVIFVGIYSAAVVYTPILSELEKITHPKEHVDTDDEDAKKDMEI